MKWVETRIVFDAPDPAAASDLIAEIFYDFGLQGVVVESPDVDSDLDWADNPLPRPQEHAVIGYFPKNAELPERCRILETRLSRLTQSFRTQSIDMTCRIAYHDIDEEDWAESWKQYFFTEKITDTLVVKPTWRDYTPNPGEIILEIDPGMAFGTGTHPTTRLCIALIEKYLRPGDTFLDIGTGSGILMIAAAKLGAAKLTGIDNDAVAVDVARQNLLQNQISPNIFDVRAGNLVTDVSGRFSLVTANILSEVIVRLADDILPVLEKNAVFICSGIISVKQAMVEEKLRTRGFEILETRTQDEWVAMASRISSP